LHTPDHGSAPATSFTANWKNVRRQTNWLLQIQ
jgi:hypothetical protein